MIELPEATTIATQLRETISGKRILECDTGKSDRNVFDKQGMYSPIMDRTKVGTPCSNCGTAIQKISYLGGSCYICPQCQK